MFYERFVKKQGNSSKPPVPSLPPFEREVKAENTSKKKKQKEKEDPAACFFVPCTTPTTRD